MSCQDDVWESRLRQAAHCVALRSPQYYGIRLGRLIGAERRYGLEVEFIHLKVISDTSKSFVATGQVQGLPVQGTVRMDTIAERYAMTHGLNFVLINGAFRRAIGDGAVAFTARAGAGPTYPHAESSIGGVRLEQYEYAGMGVHAAAGFDVRLRRQLSTIVEYKFTAARPVITIAGDGTGRMLAVTHQLGAGLAFGLSR